MVTVPVPIAVTWEATVVRAPGSSPCTVYVQVLWVHMILDFADEVTEDVFHGNRTKAARRCLPQELWTAAQRKLDRLNRAKEPRDLADPPGNRLEALKGDYAGFFSIRINDQYRIVFRFERGDAREVGIVDYH